MTHYDKANQEFEIWIETYDEYTLLCCLEHLIKAGKQYHKLVRWLKDYILWKIG